jgi:hypothetical protein
MARKPIAFGLPEPGTDRSGYISGGCCVPEDEPAFGYECEKCKRAFYVKDGELKSLDEDEEMEEIDDDIETLEMLDMLEDDELF